MWNALVVSLQMLYRTKLSYVVWCLSFALFFIPLGMHRIASHHVNSLSLACLLSHPRNPTIQHLSMCDVVLLVLWVNIAGWVVVALHVVWRCIGRLEHITLRLNVATMSMHRIHSLQLPRHMHCPTSTPCHRDLLNLQPLLLSYTYSLPCI
jgi:hypothetical protein